MMICCNYFHQKYILCPICFQLFINIALPDERIGVLFSSYCFETIFYIDRGTEAKGVEEDIWVQEGCNKRVVKAA